MASLGKLPQAFRPGAGWGYSNAGTSIAGHAAERVTGDTWDRLLRHRILDPAGLIHAVTRPEELPYQRVAAGHSVAVNGARPAVVRPWYITQAQGPAGSTLAMSALDLASFGRLFLREGRGPNGRRVLSESTVKTMMTTVVKVATRSFTEYWCVGLEREQWSGTPVFGHAGGNMSGTSYLKIFPERDGVLALTANTPGAFGVLAEQIFDGFGPAVFRATRSKLVKPRAVAPIADPERYLGSYRMLGTTYTVTSAGSALEMAVKVSGPGGAAATVTTYRLVPLEPDVFLLEGGSGMTGGLGDVGFFGDDGRGRATNLTAPVFPAKRVP